MTIPFWTLVFATVAPYLWFGLAAPQRIKQFGHLEVNVPRTQQAKAEGLAARLIAAHSNAFEALAIYAPAVIVAHLAGADPGHSTILALVWVGARTLHGIFYALDKAPLRTLVFTVGLLASAGFYVLAAIA